MQIGSKYLEIWGYSNFNVYNHTTSFTITDMINYNWNMTKLRYSTLGSPLKIRSYNYLIKKYTFILWEKIYMAEF